tara:strand:- start:775 stop:1437 length:663 start_codon:yes stop_codon:yes gene_type:complete
MREFWSKYNLKQKKLAAKIIKYNSKFNINFLEKGHYNHTRDLLAISMAFLNKKKKIKVLDFGSNIVTLANLNNKINISKCNFTIFDPFNNKNNKKIKIENVKYKITCNEKKIMKEKFQLIHFGSSIQYEEKFLDKIDHFNLKETKVIIFTHTPISMELPYCSDQTNHLKLIQYIHSLNHLIKKLKEKKFFLIFKSRNENKYIACEKRSFKTYSLNLIFKK